MADPQAVPARFNALLEHSTDGVLIAETPSLTIFCVNDLICSALDLRPENLIGRSLRDIVSPTAVASLLGDLIGGTSSLKRNGKATTVLMGRHDLLVPVELTAKFDSSAPDERHLVVLARDIRDRQRAESRSRRSERLYNLLSQNVLGFIWSVNEKLEPTFVSPSVLHTRGFTDDETLNQSLDQILAPASHAALAGIFAEEQSRAETPEDSRTGVRTVELEMYRRDGTTVWTETSLSVYRRESGRALGFVALSRDITERRHARSERDRMLSRLQQNQKRESLGTLAGGIAHQFNNILAAILGYAELIEEDLDKSSPQYPRIRKIETAAQQASMLTRQMLAYAGHDNPGNSLLPVNPIVQNMEHLLRASMGRGVDLRIEGGSELPRVEGDFSQLQQVVLNLAVNASDAIGERGGIVGIRTACVAVNGEPPSTDYRTRSIPRGRYAIIDVVDDGCGIEAADISKVFEPFYTTKFAGRGLGLAATLGIVEAHGGAIEVHSAPQEGSRFRVFLPAANAPRVDTPVSAGVESKGVSRSMPCAPTGVQVLTPSVDTPSNRGPRAVIATADESTLRVADRTLQAMGYFVEYVSESDALVPHLQQDRAPEVLVLEAGLGRSSPIDMIEEVRRYAPDAAILMCGDLGHVWGADGVPPGVASIARPIESDNLIGALRAILCSRIAG